MMTVKMGAELFTVSAKDTATFLRLTKPRTTVVNLTNGDKYNVDAVLSEKQGINTEPVSVFVYPVLNLHFLLQVNFYRANY